MSLPEPIIACARIVEKGDPPRFRTVMAAPVAARTKLFPLYAFNVEVARAPWVTQEPMIAEMRLQWWRDVLEEIAAGGPVRAHEVATPLAATLTPDLARMLDPLVAARRWDAYRDPFEDAHHLDRYIAETAGVLMRAAVMVLGGSDDTAVAALGQAAGYAAFLRAIPALTDAGRIPLIDGTPEGVRALAQKVRQGISRPRTRPVARPALWPAMGSAKTLSQAAKDPAAVADGRLDPGLTAPRLMFTALTGRLVL